MLPMFHYSLSAKSLIIAGSIVLVLFFCVRFLCLCCRRVFVFFTFCPYLGHSSPFGTLAIFRYFTAGYSYLVYVCLVYPFLSPSQRTGHKGWCSGSLMLKLIQISRSCDVPMVIKLRRHGCHGDAHRGCHFRCVFIYLDKVLVCRLFSSRFSLNVRCLFAWQAPANFCYY